MYKRIKGGWSKHFDFMIIDLLCLLASFYLACLLRFGFHRILGMAGHNRYLVLIIAFHFILVFFSEPYSGILRRGKLQEFKQTLSYAMKFTAGALIYLFFTKTAGSFSRLAILYFWVGSIFTITVARLLLKEYIKTRAKTSRKTQYLVVITEYKHARKIIEKLQTNGVYSDLKIMGLVIVDQNKAGSKIAGVPIVASKEDMLEYLRINVVDQILLDGQGEWLSDTVNLLVNMGLTVHINIDQLSNAYPNCIVEELNGFNVVTTSVNVASDRQLFLKRCLDIVGGTIGMLICGIAFLFVAPIIKLQSHGPVFFAQKRVGKNGRQFKLYKFRSMYMDAEERKKELMEQNEMQGLMFKMENDPRIFPFGRFIRKFSIDELPQFWNVLKGEMSLVGTRPPTVDEYEQYKIEHKARLAAKPGLTGMWQISGRSDITDFDEVVNLDNEYIKNWRLGLDLKIIFKTIPAVFGGGGAK